MKQIVWSNWSHEPIDHLRRLGPARLSVFTLGEWLPEWYDRIHSEELIKKGAEMGINTIYTHFFKGFGLVHERDEMERTRELVKIAHKYGIEVIGYITGSLYYETLLDEIPDLKNWMTLDKYGNPLPYGSAYYRWKPCLQSREYIEYYKKVISYGIKHVGLDGFHFDGAKAVECRCPRCVKAFREYLTEHIKNPRELVGLSHFNNVEIPPDLDWNARPDELHDVLTIYRGRFRHHQLYKSKEELFDYIKELGGKYVIHNPGMLRGGAFVDYCDPSSNPKSCDFVFAENQRPIGRRNDQNITNVLAYKLAERFNFKLFDATWYHNGQAPGDAGVFISNEKHILDRFLTQGMIYGGISGAPWFVRSKKTGSVVVIDDENHYNTAKSAFDYFKTNKKLYDSKSLARVKLLYNTDTFYGFVKTSYKFFQEQADWLNDNNVPFVVITGDEIDKAKADDVIVLPDYKYASNSEYEKLKNASERGVRILMLGEYGLCNEFGKERDGANEIRNLKALKGVIKEIPEDVKFKTDAENTLTEIRRNANGNVTLHLLRIENENTLPSATVEFKNLYLDKDMKPVLYSIDEDCKIKSCEITDEKVTLKIENLTTMVSIEFVK